MSRDAYKCSSCHPEVLVKSASQGCKVRGSSQKWQVQSGVPVSGASQRCHLGVPVRGVPVRVVPIRVDIWCVPVDLKGVCQSMPLEALAENQLEDISSLYVLLGLVHTC